MGKLIYLVGQIFGRLLVIRRVENDKSGNIRYLCLCDCGREVIVRYGNLTSGHTQSCGCLLKDKPSHLTHGHTRRGKWTSTYLSWTGMFQRCYNPRDKRYKDYGGRGIKVCIRWHKFENFLADMGEKPRGLTLERVDVNGHYELRNCKWDTDKNQARNRRNNIILTLNGVSHCAGEWAEILNWKVSTIYRRKKLGWSDEKTLTTPIRGKGGM